MPASLIKRYIGSHFGSYATSTTLALLMIAADALTPRVHGTDAPVFRLIGENAVPRSVVLTTTLVIALHALLIVSQSFVRSTKRIREYILILVSSLESFFAGALWLTAWIAFYDKNVWGFPLAAYALVMFLVLLRWLSIGKNKSMRWAFRIGYAMLFIWCIIESIIFLWDIKQPNQALQHNDHVCHGLCGRTLRASHDRG